MPPASLVLQGFFFRLWAVQVFPPSLPRARRWNSLLHRLAASFLSLAPEQGEAQPEFFRRRIRDARDSLKRASLTFWDERHSRAYFRAAWRLSSSSSVLHAIAAWRDRWWEFTHRALDRSCGGRSVGRPTRWEEPLVNSPTLAGVSSGSPVLGVFSQTEEDAFVAWVLSQ